MNGQELALKYEKLLTLAVQRRGLPQYDYEAVAGGGRMSAKEHGEHGVVYALWVVARLKEVPRRVVEGPMRVIDLNVDDGEEEELW